MMAQELDFSNELVTQDLMDFGRRTFERIQQNFKRLGISPYNPNHIGKDSKLWLRGGKIRSRGALYRSIFWKVYNEAGGDMAKVSFFFNHYAVFVETGTGAGVKWSPLPELVKLSTLKRPNTRRLAKPFLMSEIRLHARMTLEQMAEHFAYTAGMFIVNSVKKTPIGASPEVVEQIFLNKE